LRKKLNLEYNQINNRPKLSEDLIVCYVFLRLSETM
jgi:hypothetical protein